MSVERTRKLDERTQCAIDEIKGLIRSRYPDATFNINESEDPEGVYLWVTIDVNDAEEATDLYVNRLLDTQIDEGLDLYVIPLETPERSAKHVRDHPFVPRPHRLVADGSGLVDWMALLRGPAAGPLSYRHTPESVSVASGFNTEIALITLFWHGCHLR